MRYLGLDYGSKSIGVAVSDKDGKVSFPLTVVKARPLEGAVGSIKALVVEKEVDVIVVGLPRSLTGSISEQAKDTTIFASLLEKDLNMQVVLHDERLTSKQAEKSIIMKRGMDKTIIDKIAATLMLQSFLDCKRNDDQEDS